MTAKPLRIGFAGASDKRGWARDAHLAAIRALPGLAVQAVLARTQPLADAAAQAFGAVSAYADTAAMMRDPEIDVIAVTVRVPEHRDIVLAALEAGKHVYCEWPLGRDVAEARLLADAARKSGVHAVVGTQGVAAPAVRHAAKLVEQNAIGRPLALRVVSATGGWSRQIQPFYVYLEDKTSGATLSTIAGGHTLAAIEAVVGPYIELNAINSTLRQSARIAGTDEHFEQLCVDHVLVIGRHESGCVSTLEVLGGTADLPFCFQLRGDNGKLEITGHHPGGYQCYDLSVAVTPEAMAQPAPVVDGLTGPPVNVAELWAAFAGDIRNDTRTVPDFDSAVRVTALLDAINAASDSGQRVSVARFS